MEHKGLSPPPARLHLRIGSYGDHVWQHSLMPSGRDSITGDTNHTGHSSSIVSAAWPYCCFLASTSSTPPPFTLSLHFTNTLSDSIAPPCSCWARSGWWRLFSITA